MQTKIVFVEEGISAFILHNLQDTKPQYSNISELAITGQNYLQQLSYNADIHFIVYVHLLCRIFFSKQSFYINVSIRFVLYSPCGYLVNYSSRISLIENY